MKIKLTESQFNRLMDMDELGTISGTEKWKYKPKSLSTIIKLHNTEKEKSEGKLNYLWQNKLNLGSLMDFAFGDEIKIDVYLHDIQTILGYIVLENFEDGFSVVDIHISEEFGGKEYGLNIYVKLTKLLNKPIYSGQSQTIFSRKGIWKKLMDRYPENVVGYHNGSDQYLEMRDGELYAGDCVVYGHDEDCGDVRLKLLP